MHICYNLDARVLIQKDILFLFTQQYCKITTYPLVFTVATYHTHIIKTHFHAMFKNQNHRDVKHDLSLPRFLPSRQTDICRRDDILSHEEFLCRFFLICVIST